MVSFHPYKEFLRKSGTHGTPLEQDVTSSDFLLCFTSQRSKSIPAFLRSLEISLPGSQVFVDPASDAIECLLDILDRVSHAEAQIALAEVAEGGPRERGNAGVVQQRAGQFLRWPSGRLDIGKNIERT